MAAVALATGAGFAVFPFLDLANIVMVYLLATLLVAMRGHRGAAVLSAALGVLCFDFFFVPPRYTFQVADTQYIFTFIAMFAVAVLISHLTVGMRAQAEAARVSEERTAAMHALSRDLASAREPGPILEAARRHVTRIIGGEVSILSPGDGRRLEAGDLGEKERAVAQWVFEKGTPAGLGTETLPVADALYLPLTGARGPAGVLRVRPLRPEDVSSPDQRLLLESFAHQIGLALEVERLQDEAKRALLEAEKERLRSSLLSSVSHDLRTPLAGIIGSAESLLQQDGKLSAAARDLLENIQSEGERLARLVENLIETTRLETGAARLRKELHPIEELVGAALARVDKALSGRKVETRIPEDLPLAPLDSVLIEQVLINLLENACRHTPARAPIEVCATSEKGSLLIEVSDRGPGLAPEELERVFEKFYHAQSPAAGAGLGLAICRAVVIAHGGRIWAENRPGGGAVFRFTLPLEETLVRA